MQVAVRKGDGWLINNGTGSVHLTHNQYARFLAWKLSKHSIEDMFPDLSDAERKTLVAGTDPSHV